MMSQLPTPRDSPRQLGAYRHQQRLALTITAAAVLLVFLLLWAPHGHLPAGNAGALQDRVLLSLRSEGSLDSEESLAATAAAAAQKQQWQRPQPPWMPQQLLPQAVRQRQPPPPPPPPLASCAPHVEDPEVWAMSCQLLKQACVDQRTIILYDPKYQADGERQPKALPVLQPLGKQSNTYYWFYRTGVERGRMEIPPIEVRPASKFEAPPYLANPTFSNCTVPVVYFPFWADNPAHVLRDNGAKLFLMLQAARWRKYAKLVVHTPDGLQLPAFAAEVLQTLTNHTLETWADFTTRLQPGDLQRQPRLRAGFPGGPRLPPSYEGWDQRCFRRMYVCTNVTGSRSLPAYSFGQHVVHTYWQQHPEAGVAGEATAAAGEARSASQTAGAGAAGTTAAAAAGAAWSPSPAAAAAAAAAWVTAGDAGANRTAVVLPPGGTLSGDRVLRIVLQKRIGGHPGRHILNVPELLEACNSWSYVMPSGQRVQTQCHEAQFPDLPTGISEARAADVMVGMHGANLANGYFMRPGGAVIEIHSPGMQAVAEHLQFAERNLLDPHTQVQWWVLMVCDPHAWERDAVEVEGRGNYATWVKARSVRLRWDALAAVLKAAAKAHGNMQLYRKRYEEGRFYWHMLKQGAAFSPGKYAKCPSGNASSSSMGSGGSSISAPANTTGAAALLATGQTVAR